MVVVVAAVVVVVIVAVVVVVVVVVIVAVVVVAAAAAVVVVVVVWSVCACQPKVHVNYDFQPRGPDELEIRRGEVITVVDNSDNNWYEGQVERDNVVCKGHFPVTYVTPIWADSSHGYCGLWNVMKKWIVTFPDPEKS